MRPMDFRGGVATSQAFDEDRMASFISSMMIKLHAIMWLHLGAPFLIRRMWLNDDDSHPWISSEPLIEDETSNPMVTPKFCLFILSLFNGKFILGCFKQSNCVDISILESLAFVLFLVDFQVYGVSEVRFYWENRKKSPLEFWNLFLKSWNEKPLICWSIGSFQAQLLVRLYVFLLIFHSVLLDFNF